MTPTRPFTRRAAPLALLSALWLAGCGGKSSQPAGPAGDNSGERLVVFASDGGRPAGDHGIALYDFDLGAFHSLAGLDDVGSESDPCISNDGNFVVFSATRGSGATGSDIYIYDRLKQALLPTPGLNTARNESWPRFTYDSVHLAFVTSLATGERRVRLYEPFGDTLIALPGLDATPGSSDDMPAPNVDGSRIAFVSTRNGSVDVLVWNRVGGITPIAGLATADGEVEPSLSPNGRWLAFASDRPGGAGGIDVFLYDLVADSLVALPGLNSAGDDRHPSVSADGDVIVFQSDRTGGGGQFDLYRFTRSSGVLDQPAVLKDASDDIQPYLRWR